MKKVIIFNLLVLLGICTSCTLTVEPKASLTIQDELIIFNSDSTFAFLGNRLSLYSTVADRPNRLICTFYSVADTLSFTNILSRDTAYMSLAYYMLKNKGELPIKLTLKDCNQKIYFDTTFTKNYQNQNNSDIETQIVSGRIAPLVDPLSTSEKNYSVRKWLYHNQHKNLEDSTVKQMIQYLRVLQNNGQVSLEVESRVPIHREKSTAQVKLKSNMQADYFYLVGVRNNDALNEFIESKIISNFQDAKTSVDQIEKVSVKPHYGGVHYVMLIGINRDWTYQVDPIGVYCIDNMPPSLFFSHSRMYIPDYSEKSNGCTFQCNDVKININIKDIYKPIYTGEVDVSYGKFQGYGMWLSVPYTITWSGDVKYVRIINPKFPRWDDAGYPKRLVIDTHKKQSPYKVAFYTYLSTGDNFIPVEVEDNYGNVHTLELSIPTERIKDDQPRINIDNTIYN